MKCEVCPLLHQVLTEAQSAIETERSTLTAERSELHAQSATTIAPIPPEGCLMCRQARQAEAMRCPEYGFALESRPSTAWVARHAAIPARG